MNHIKKVLMAGALMLGLILPAAASASTTYSYLTINGEFAPSGLNVGDVVDMRVGYTLSGNSTAQSAKVEIQDTSGNDVAPFVCVELIPRQNSNGFHVSDIPGVDTLGTTEGNHDVKITLYGDVTPGINTQCNDLDGTHTSFTFHDQLTLGAQLTSGSTAINTGHTVTSGTGTGGNGASGGPIIVDPLTAKINSLIDLINVWFQKQASTTVTQTNTSTICSGLMSLQAGLSLGSTGPAVSNLQAFLISHGGSIPAITLSGVPYGYFGHQTQGAIFTVSSVNGCN